MNCSECGAAIRTGQSFCGQCGTALQAVVGQNSNGGSNSTTRSMPTSALAPIAITSDPQDFWRLGALGVLLISTFVPAISLPGGLSLSVIQLGLFGWLAVLVILALGAVTAVPSWRPGFWGPLERFVSAALVGNVLTIFVFTVGIGAVVSHLVARLTQSAGGLGSAFLGGATSMAVHVGFGLILALIGSVAWAVVTRRRI